VEITNKRRRPTARCKAKCSKSEERTC